jgi:ATP-dependent DNA ligase
MSYHFRLILTHFSGCGATLSYFFGLSRTGETDSLERLCVGPTGCTYRAGYDNNKSARQREGGGSLVLAVRDQGKKRWVYAGHVGTGFNQVALKSIYETMQPLRTDKKPFDQKVKDENATTLLMPQLVGDVKFTEWTSESEMRHPVFLGLRTDKKAIDVFRE